MDYAFPLFSAFGDFIIERHQIYLRRQKGQSAPWTKDPILGAYRFCNVYRELDRTTIWITKRWREPYQNYAHLWFAMAVARLVNHPPTLAQFTLPGRWNKEQFLRVMRDRKSAGEQVFGGAYIISTGGQSVDKAIYLANDVLDPMWAKRKLLSQHDGESAYVESLGHYYSLLMEQNGFGSFMAAQVVADLKYTPPFKNATDWWTFASSGPGSRRGLNYVMGRDPAMRWVEYEWRDVLSDLHKEIASRIERADMPRLHAQDLQNCLCEFSKYQRTKLGTGRPKQKFSPFSLTADV